MVREGDKHLSNIEEPEFNIEDLVEETKSVGDVSIERKMCINSIMSTEFIKGVKPLLADMSLIESVVCRTILQWNKTFYEAYGTAMKKDVIGVYESARSKLNVTTSKDINDFLSSISQQYADGEGDINVKFELDIAEEYLDKQGVKKLVNSVEKNMLTGNTTKAKATIANYAQIRQAPGAPVDGMKDFSRFRRTKDRDDVLFEMSYPFSELYGPICERHLSASSARAKVGKTRELAWFACQALRNGLTVFIASLEMSEDAFLSLIDAEILREYVDGGSGVVPMFKGKGEGTEIVFKKLQKDPKTPEELEEKWKAFGMFNPTAKLYCKEWSQMSCSIEDDLIPHLDQIRANDGVDIKCVIIDYADLLKANKGDERADERIRIGNQWKSLKKMSQDRHLHTHTASQLSRENVLASSISKEQDANFIIKLEQTPNEKNLGVYRQYVSFHREIPYDASRALITLSNNGIGLFNLDARWSSDSWDHIPDVEEDIRLWKPNTGQEWRDEVNHGYDAYY
jgi:hypothetical protein